MNKVKRAIFEPHSPVLLNLPTRLQTSYKVKHGSNLVNIKIKLVNSFMIQGSIHHKVETRLFGVGSGGDCHEII